eukprot:TRINITY_DN913_c0_g1_i1.p1 TRINITY_DN913_c0_g1~~TRINITY_DN913_c0_g1_i1.p1  ORF type:complete len:208 (+),score=42.44 TRINITY_DN913_c0_g1_i1:82-705(+)
MQFLLKEIIQFDVFSKLPPYDLHNMMFVSKQFRLLSEENPTVWKSHCAALWDDKIIHPSLEENEESKNDRTYWKRMYFTSIADSQRTEITEEELCAHFWEFCFVDTPDVVSNHGLFIGKYGVLFMSNYPLMRYITCHNEEGEYGVQVETFPLHVISRREDWGWVLKNPYVIFQTPPGDATQRTQEMIHFFYENIRAHADIQNEEDDE